MGTRKGSYRYENLQVRDVIVALMQTEKDVILRLADGHTSSGIARGERGGHWLHIKGTEGELEWKRSNSDKCRFWSAKLHLNEPIEVDWSSSRGDAPPEAKGSGHGDLDYYTFAVFADAVLYDVKLYFDVYKAADITAPAILAAESVNNGNRPFDVPDFRPGVNRKPGKMPEGLQG